LDLESINVKFYFMSSTCWSFCSSLLFC